MGIRPRAVLAVFRRDFGAYFGSPTGYVFITIFIVVSAALAFDSDAFFANNLADLSALNAVFIWLPIFFIPAIAMGAWAEERKLGTEELLLTLPLRDVEVVLGKYLATLGVYTISLIFALCNTLVLAYLGDPDWGLLFANYLGYWFVGAALLPLALAASSLTSNMTVAFILGTVFCACAMFIGAVADVIPGLDSRAIRDLGVQSHFENFVLGVISLPDVVYFVLVAAVFLYVNMILIGRRHWSGGKDGPKMWAHYLVRGVAVVVVALALSVLAVNWVASARADTTSEGLNSLSPETAKLIADLPGDKPVYVRAFLSPDPPESYVRTRQDVVRILRQIDAIGGARILVSIQETVPYSETALEASERFDITAAPVSEIKEGRMESAEIYMGLAFTCGPRQRVIKFLPNFLPVEYELVSAIRTVARAKRRTIGVLNTDVKVYGGFDFTSMPPRQNPAWPIIEELKKQYDVVQAQPNADIDPNIDVLIAALPSTLTQPEMDHLMDYIKSGRPCLLLIDPAPLANLSLAPKFEEKKPRRMPMQNRPPGQKKGDIDAFLAEIGLSWTKTRVIWDKYKSPKLKHLPPEFVMVSRDAGGARPFNKEEIIVNHLQRLLFLYPGAIRPLPGSALTVTPLLTTGAESGHLRWEEVIQRNFMGFGLAPDPRHERTDQEYILAARVSGVFPAAADEPEEKKDAKGKKDEKEKPEADRANVIAIADLDFVSELFFGLRTRNIQELNFDNITFVLNCVDMLAGDASLVALRSRRPRYGALTKIEAIRREFRKKLEEQETNAEDEAKKQLEQAQKSLDERVEALKKRKGLDAKTRRIMLYNLETDESRRLEEKKKQIEAEKKERIQQAVTAMGSNIRGEEDQVRFWAVVLPPLPAIVVGILVYIRQRRRERVARK